MSGTYAWSNVQASLEKVIGTMSSSELNQISEQLRDILSEMSIIRPKTLGSVTSGPYRNGFFPRHILPLHAFSTYTEFIEFYRDISAPCHSQMHCFLNFLVTSPFALRMETCIQAILSWKGRPLLASLTGRRLAFGICVVHFNQYYNCFPFNSICTIKQVYFYPT